MAALRSLSEPGEDEDDNDDVEEFFRRHDDRVQVEGIGDQRSGVTLLRLANLRFVLDMDAREICKTTAGYRLDGLPYVVDLPSRLTTTKIL